MRVEVTLIRMLRAAQDDQCIIAANSAKLNLFIAHLRFIGVLQQHKSYDEKLPMRGSAIGRKPPLAVASGQLGFSY